MKQTKKSKQKSNPVKKPDTRNLTLLTGILIGLLFGMLFGYFAWNTDASDPRYAIASKEEIKKAKQDIAQKFKTENPADCSYESYPTSPADRGLVFDEYLQVNKYGNRAVIRGCNDYDSLLVKDAISGEWVSTNINVSLDLRANPAWQVECLIDDITEADDETRYENSSIDAYNFVECRQLKEREQIVDILDKSGMIKRSEIKDEDIQAYTEAAESF